MRAMIRGLFAFVLRVFFQRVETVGLENVPTTGPVMVVPNHPNGLVDPICILCLAPRPAAFLAKEPIFRMPVLGWLARTLDAIPVYRRQDEGADLAKNRETFARARAVLMRGGMVTIFPEGASHSDPKLRPLKTGAARIALGAAGSGEGLAEPLRIVPAGLYYTAKGRFRSAVLLHFGEPIVVEPVPLGPNDEPPAAAVRALTAQIEATLAVRTLQADHHEALALAARAESVLTSTDPGDEGTLLLRQLDFRQRCLKGYAVLRARDPARLERVERQLRAYEAKLGFAGVAAARIAVENFTLANVLRYTLKRFGLALLLTPLAAVGIVIHYPAYRATGAIATRLAKGDDDVVSTIKMLAAMLLFPLSWILLALVVGLWQGTTAALASLCLAPVAGYVALRFSEGLEGFIGAARALLLFTSRRRAFLRLVAERTALRDQLVSLARELEL